MSTQKILILFISVAGLGSTFLPWIKNDFIGSVFGISDNGPLGNDEKDLFWLLIAFFIVPILICLIDNKRNLTGRRLFWTLFFPALNSVISLLFLFIDLQSQRVDVLLGIHSASELNLKFGPAPYLVFLTGVLVIVFGISLKGTLLAKS